MNFSTQLKAFDNRRNFSRAIKQVVFIFDFKSSGIQSIILTPTSDGKCPSLIIRYYRIRYLYLPLVNISAFNQSILVPTSSFILVNIRGNWIPFNHWIIPEFPLISRVLHMTICISFSNNCNRFLKFLYSVWLIFFTIRPESEPILNTGMNQTEEGHYQNLDWADLCTVAKWVLSIRYPELVCTVSNAC